MEIYAEPCPSLKDLARRLGQGHQPYLLWPKKDAAIGSKRTEFRRCTVLSDPPRRTMKVKVEVGGVVEVNVRSVHFQPE